MSDIMPTVGRVVHYMSYGTPGGEFPSVARASIITNVHSKDEVDLCVLNPTGMFFNTHVKRDENKAGGTWDWMDYQKGQAEKVEEQRKEFHKTLEQSGIDRSKGIY